MSDLAGFDPVRHDGKAETVVRKVVTWLATRPDAIYTPTAREVLDALPAFQAEKMKLTESWGEDIPWADIVLMAIKTVPKL